MDFSQLSAQLSAQIGTQPAGGEQKASSGGGPLGSPSHGRGFSTVLHAVSHKTGVRRDANPRASQTETGDRPSTTMTAARRAMSRKADDSRGAKPRAPEAETDARSSTPATTVLRGGSRKADGSTDAEPRASQSESDDGLSTTTSDVPSALSQETSSGTDTEPHAAQSETGDEPSTTTSGSEPLLLSLLGATMVTQASVVAPTQEATGTDASTNQGDGLSGIAETPTIQPIAQPTEGIENPVRSATGLSDLADHTTTAATEDAVAGLSSPMPERQSLSVGTDTNIPAVEKSDTSQPLTALQGQEAESHDPHQGLPIMEHREKDVPQAPVPSGQVAADGQDPARLAATATTQPTRQNGEEVAAQPDRSPAQQTLEKAEPSLHQKNRQAESSENQTAAALSGRTQTEGQGFNTESDGQRKEEGLKWFSRVDLQSAEVSSRTPQESAVEPLDAGRQDLSYSQGQGGTPSTIKSAPAPAVPLSSQANRLGQDTETAPVPLTHAVQFDLAPADFGQLRVRVVLSDQTIHTHMSTDRAELGQMLTGQQEQLSTQLSAAGLDLGRFQVQVDQERTNHSGQDWPSQAHQGTSQQQRDPRQQDRPQDVSAPLQKRTGVLSLFA